MQQHELILALLGCPGDLISSNGAVYEVSAQVNFLSGAEVQALNQVVQIGASYEKVLAFIDSAERSLCQRALANGLEDQLARYRDAVVELEAEVMAGDKPTSYLRFKLMASHFDVIMPALGGLVTRLSSGATGVQILELLRDGAAAGPAPVTE